MEPTVIEASTSVISPLRLPRGDILFYPTGRPNIRVLTRQIRALGYSTWYLHVDIPGFQQQKLPKAVWLHAVVLGRVILFIADPAECGGGGATHHALPPTL